LAAKPYGKGVKQKRPASRPGEMIS